MSDDALAQRICETALQCGYDDCGIIPIAELEEYNGRFRERLQKARLSFLVYSQMKAFTRLEKDFPYLNPQKSLKWNLTAIFKHYGVDVQVKQWSKPRYYDHPFFDINYYREQDRALITEVLCILEGRWNNWESLQYAKDLSPKGYCWHESRTGNSYDDHIFHNCFEEKFGRWQSLQCGFLVRETARA